MEGAPDTDSEDSALAAWGLQRAGPAPDPAYALWAELEPAVRLFMAMQTQWRMGPAGPTGLDYSALPEVERRFGIRPRQARRAFLDLRVMEAEALRWMAQRRAR